MRVARLPQAVAAAAVRAARAAAPAGNASCVRVMRHNAERLPRVVRFKR